MLAPANLPLADNGTMLNYKVKAKVYVTDVQYKEQEMSCGLGMSLQSRYARCPKALPFVFIHFSTPILLYLRAPRICP